MPIKNLTNRGLAFPEIGQIRKGAPKDANGKIGKDLNYFRVTFDEAETEASEKFLKIYGSEPQEINILLPFNDIGACWEAWLEAYTAGRMVARSDGEKFEYLLDTKTGEIKVTNGYPNVPYKQGQSVGTYTDGKGKVQEIFCSEVGRLKVVIPELQRLAYVTILTSSKHDIANIDSQLAGLKKINDGIISGIPMVLRRRPKKISTPKPDGTRVRYTKWMLSIEADPMWVQRKLSEINRFALPDDVNLLPGEIIEDEEIQALESPTEPIDAIIEEIPEQEQAEEIPEDQPAKAPPNRPYEASLVREKIKAIAEEASEEKANQKQIGLMISVIEKIFASGDASKKRHELCAYLTGTGSTKDITGPYILAILKWLNIQTDSGGDKVPGDFVVDEAKKILLARVKESGQMDAFG